MWNTSPAIPANRTVGDAELCSFAASSAAATPATVLDPASRGVPCPKHEATAIPATVSGTVKPRGQGSVRNAG
jgi:hypothetical protein